MVRRRPVWPWRLAPCVGSPTLSPCRPHWIHPYPPAPLPPCPPPVPCPLILWLAYALAPFLPRCWAWSSWHGEKMAERLGEPWTMSCLDWTALTGWPPRSPWSSQLELAKVERLAEPAPALMRPAAMPGAPSPPTCVQSVGCAGRVPRSSYGRAPRALRRLADAALATLYHPAPPCSPPPLHRSALQAEPTGAPPPACGAWRAFGASSVATWAPRPRASGLQWPAH